VKLPFAFLTLVIAGCGDDTEVTAVVSKVPGSAEEVRLQHISAVQKAFDRSCPGQPKIDYAQCVPLDDPTEFRCEYSHETWDVEKFPEVFIAADKGSYVLIDIPEYCAKQ